MVNSKGFTYQGYFFYEGTPKAVAEALVRLANSGARVRLFYGDRRTGRDNLEEYETMGYVRTISSPEGKKLILVKTKSSPGGGVIPTSLIVKITRERDVLVEHPNYYLGNFTVEPNTMVELQKQGYEYSVSRDGSIVASFTTKEKAESWVKFITGERNIRR